MRYLSILLTFTLAIFMTSCMGTKTPEVTKTQLEIRQLQTKIFPTSDYKMMLKAIMNVLQDDGWIIYNINSEMGFVKASKILDIESRWSAFFHLFLMEMMLDGLKHLIKLFPLTLAK